MNHERHLTSFADQVSHEGHNDHCITNELLRPTIKAIGSFINSMSYIRYEVSVPCQQTHLMVNECMVNQSGHLTLGLGCEQPLMFSIATLVKYRVKQIEQNKFLALCLK